MSKYDLKPWELYEAANPTARDHSNLYDPVAHLLCPKQYVRLTEDEALADSRLFFTRRNRYVELALVPPETAWHHPASIIPATADIPPEIAFQLRAALPTIFVQSKTDYGWRAGIYIITDTITPHERETLYRVIARYPQLFPPTTELVFDRRKAKLCEDNNTTLDPLIETKEE